MSIAANPPRFAASSSHHPIYGTHRSYIAVAASNVACPDIAPLDLCATDTERHRGTNRRWPKTKKNWRRLCEFLFITGINIDIIQKKLIFAITNLDKPQQTSRHPDKAVCWNSPPPPTHTHKKKIIPTSRC